MTFIVFAILAVLLVLALRKDKEIHNFNNKPCRKGHSWEEVPVDNDDDLVFLRCKVCKGTFPEILND